MNDEELRFLKEFDDEAAVCVASENAFGQLRSFQVPAIVIGAWKNGLLEIRDGDSEPLKDSKALYTRILMLTPAGRKACDLPPLEPDAPKPKPKPKSPQRELF